MHLPHNPSLSRGVLPNGLSYAILPTAPSPPWWRGGGIGGSDGGRVAVRLRIRAGSVHEADTEQGFAHLLEHCSFMGSRQRLWLCGTGSDSTARTDFLHTSYAIEAPRRCLPRALRALREIGFDPQLSHGRLLREQRVVLAEAATIATPAHRLSKLHFRALHGEHSRLAQRFPIGSRECIRAATPEALRSFHATNFRPERATLYIAGNVEQRQAQRLVRRFFGGVPQRGDQPWLQLEPPDQSVVWPRVVAHEVAGLEHVSLSWLRKRRLSGVTDEAELRAAALELVAAAVLQERLARGARRDGDAPEQQAQVESELVRVEVEVEVRDAPEEACEVLQVVLRASPHAWRRAASSMVAAARQLRSSGATDAEVSTAVREMVLRAHAAADEARHEAPSDALAALVQADSAGDVFCAPREAAAALERAMAAVGTSEVHPALRGLIDALVATTDVGSTAEGGGTASGAWCDGAVVLAGPPDAGCSVTWMRDLLSLSPSPPPSSPPPSPPPPSPAASALAPVAILSDHADAHAALAAEVLAAAAAAAAAAERAPPESRHQIVMVREDGEGVARAAVALWAAAPPSGWAALLPRPRWRGGSASSPARLECAHALLEEVINARLFTRLRDALGLVYEASVQFVDAPDAPNATAVSASAGLRLSLVAAPEGAEQARLEATRLLGRLAAVRPAAYGGHRREKTEPITRRELRGAKRRLLAGSTRHEEAARHIAVAALSARDLHCVFGGIDLAEALSVAVVASGTERDGFDDDDRW